MSNLLYHVGKTDGKVEDNVETERACGVAGYCQSLMFLDEIKAKKKKKKHEYFAFTLHYIRVI